MFTLTMKGICQSDSASVILHFLTLPEKKVFVVMMLNPINVAKLIGWFLSDIWPDSSATNFSEECHTG